MADGGRVRCFEDVDCLNLLVQLLVLTPDALGTHVCAHLRILGHAPRAIRRLLRRRLCRGCRPLCRCSLLGLRAQLLLHGGERVALCMQHGVLLLGALPPLLLLLEEDELLLARLAARRPQLLLERAHLVS